MALGKSIRVYLPTGSVNGIRHAEIANWTGQAISCPRSEIKALSEWNEVNSPGVYFLFSADEDEQHLNAYIGEAENVRERIKEHVQKSDFWNEVIFFTNKDENLTKAHAKYLESVLIEQAKKIKRYSIENTASSNKPTLPRADRDAMDEFAANIKTLLGVLGHKILEPYLSPKTQDMTEQSSSTLRLLNKQALGELVSDGFLVHQGAEMAMTQSDAQRNTLILVFKRLIDEHVVSEKNGKYVFNQPQLFSSPSFAASILNGYPTNGLDAWRNEQGKPLKQIEQAN